MSVCFNEIFDTLGSQYANQVQLLFLYSLYFSFLFPQVEDLNSFYKK